MNASLTYKRDIASPLTQSFTEVAKILLATGLLALSAQTSVLLPFSPIPVSLQTTVIFLIAAALGPKKAALALLAYIAEGVMGLPVFIKAGCGPLWLCGPTGGYLVGFVMAAFTTGYLIEKGWHSSFFKTFLAMALGSFIILLAGTAWLTNFMELKLAFSVGFVPFILGDILKILIACSLVPLFRAKLK